MLWRPPLPRLGFSVEQDVHVDGSHHFLELIPPGSACSIALTSGYIDARRPGSLQGIQLNVDDVVVAEVSGA